MDSQKITPTIVPTIVGYNVQCLHCHEYISAPGTKIDLKIWSEEELQTTKTLECPNCGFVASLKASQEEAPLLC
jgi:DNA-directed RNA polymerase subunit RPC12/RpoP